MKPAAFLDDCQSQTDCHHSKELSNKSNLLIFIKFLKYLPNIFKKLQRSQSKHMKKHDAGKNT